MIRLLASLALLLATPVLAAAVPKPIPATCDTLVAALATATPGSTVALTGSCPSISLGKLSFVPAVTIDATAASFPGGGLYLTDVTGLNIVGGLYGPMDSGGVGIGLRRAHNVTITKARVTGLDFGISVDASDHVMIARNRIDFIRVDSIRYFNSTFGTIDRNAVLGAAPVDPHAHHPDGVQLASDFSVTSDVAITNNTVIGDAQGISMFVGSKLMGGYDRITVTGNYIATSYPQALAMYNCRACVAKGNTIVGLPGAPHFANFNFPGSAGLLAADQTFQDNR